MISVKPIEEPVVIENFLRAAGEKAAGSTIAGALQIPEGEGVQGYIISDGKSTLGYSLYTVKGGVAAVFWAEADDHGLLDGVVRASIAAAERTGAAHFTCNPACPALALWAVGSLKGAAGKVDINSFFEGHICG